MVLDRYNHFFLIYIKLFQFKVKKNDGIRMKICQQLTYKNFTRLLKLFIIEENRTCSQNVKLYIGPKLGKLLINRLMNQSTTLMNKTKLIEQLKTVVKEIYIKLNTS